jgi:large subunit ribosomal protein L32
MGLPGHRRTSSHKRRRAAHFALKKLVLAACPKCKEQMLPHKACPSCGTYAGRNVIDLKSPVAASKSKAKKEAAHDHADHAGHKHE